ncbi:MAG: hypothetical protein K5929_07165 [Lachnospiraceae bacterium]|nr:hypothetical protein [Lachnospiraceae bacterium]
MKKSRLLVVLIFCVICLSGCIRMKTDITVKWNGKVDLSLLYAVIGEGETSDTEKQNLDIEQYEREGWDVEAYDKDGFSGYVLRTKNISIDDLVSSISETRSEIADDEGGKPSLTKNGFIYTLDWQVFGKEQGDQISAYKNFFSMYGGYMKVALNLPFGAISSNATSVSYDKRNLEWDLLELGPDQSIHVTFFALSPSQIAKWIVSALFVIVLLVVGLVFLIIEKKKKNNKSEYGEILNAENRPQNINEITDEAFGTESVPYNETNEAEEPMIRKRRKTGKIGILLLIVFLLAFVGVLAMKSALDPYNKLSEEEKAAIDSVALHISELNNRSLDDDTDISEVEKEFSELGENCKPYVKNIDELTDLRNAYDKNKGAEVEACIQDLEEISLSSLNEIHSAENKYNQLTENQKGYVHNYELISQAYEEISRLRVENFENKVNEIGNVTLKSSKKIKAAREAYTDLSKEEKSETNLLSVLEKAEDELEKAQKKHDKKLVKKVEEMIDNIGTVTLDKEEAIKKAENAFQELELDLRGDVKNYKVMVEARRKYKQLEEEEALKKITLTYGSQINTSKWEVTYKGTSITTKILPNVTKGYYFYYHTDDNEVYIDIVFQIKNVHTDTVAIDSIWGGCTVEYDGKKYNKSATLFFSSGEDIDVVYDWDGIGALRSTTLHVAIKMPKEIQTNNKALMVYLTIAGTKKAVVIRK